MPTTPDRSRSTDRADDRRLRSARRRRSCSSPSPTTSRERGRKLREQIERELRRGGRARTSAPRSPRRSSSAGTTSRRGSSAATALETLALDDARTRSATSRASRRWSSPAASPTGSPRSRSARERGETVVFVARLAGPRRARRSSCSPTTRSGARRSSAARTRTRRACSSPSATCRGASACRTPALQLWAETDVFEEERRDARAPPLGARSVPLGLPRPEGRRPRRPRRQRHRRVRRPEADRASGSTPQEFMELRYAGEDKLFVPLERLDLVQKYTGGVAPGARQARRHDLGEGEDARQEGDARHGRGAAQALRRAQGRARPRLQRRLALAAGVRGRVRVRPDARSGERRSPTSSATWNRRRRWTACSAATSATARPKSRCARRSRRSWTASRSRSSRRRPSSRSST